MPRSLFVALSTVLLVGRLALVAALLCSFTITGWLLAVVGFIGCATTMWAWSEGKPDATWTGLAAGGGYLVHLAMTPGDLHLAFVGPLFWGVFAYQCWVRIHLGRCCTVTGPVFVGVRDRGPYSAVRHPMAATGLLMSVLFALEFPSLWNAFALLLIAAVDVGCCLAEEKFLLGERAYRAYAERVRWRFVPGVW